MTRKELDKFAMKASMQIKNNPISDSEVRLAAASAVERLIKLGFYK